MEPLDSKDLKIINVLKKDSRTSIRDIAKQTGLKPSTVHLRIQNLIKRNAIQYTIKVAPELAGEELEVLVYLSTQAVDPKVYDLSFIKKVLAVSGEYDTLLIVKVKNIEQFNDFFSKFREIKGILKHKTVVVTKRIKG